MNQSSENLGRSILLSDTNKHNLILGVGRVGGKNPSVYRSMHSIVKLEKKPDIETTNDL